MKFDFVVFGATGLQGRIASSDLLDRGYSVLLCGRKRERVEDILKRYKKSKFEYLDLSDYKNAVKIIKNSDADIVINCAEGDWNLHALKACAEANVHSLDLGSEIWMTKEQLAFHDEFKKKGIIHLTGCGSVPGIGNVMLNYASDKFDEINTIEVGFNWNSNIKKFVVPFSIPSIIEEFTDPATNVKEGHFVKLIPLDTIKNIEDEFVGEQETFFVRHPETYTFWKYFKNKGVKNVNFYAGFPPHSFSNIVALIDHGLGSKEEFDFKGERIKPVEFASEVLKELPYPEDYKEKEDLWVDIIGKKEGKKQVIKMRCVVPTLKGWEFAGCNIDTGMTASIMALMIKNGQITERGSFAPEAPVPPEPFFKEIAKRKMIVYENGKRIN